MWSLPYIEPTAVVVGQDKQFRMSLGSSDKTSSSARRQDLWTIEHLVIPINQISNAVIANGDSNSSNSTPLVPLRRQMICEVGKESFQ
jgi:hypothetical protein